MATQKKNIINYLDEKDKSKILFFAGVLFKHSKYEKLRTEIEARRKEIRESNTISHENFWQDV